MKKLVKLFIYIIVFSTSFTALSQEKATAIDTLKDKTAQELFDASINSYDISILEKAIEKAKEESDIDILVDAYSFMSFRLKDERVLKYSDSIIDLRDQFNSTSYPANAYYTKGFYYFNQRNFTKAADNFIKANEYANRYYNQDIIIRSKQSLGLLKKEIGDYEQALAIYKENLKYATEDKNTLAPVDYLEIIFSIGAVYINLKEYDSVTHYNNFGIKESLRLKIVDKYNAFVLNEAKSLFNQKQYSKSLDSLKKVAPYYKTSKDQTSLSNTYYYLAENYLTINEDKKAIELLEKVDSLFQKNKDVRSKIMESYDLLISYYREKKALEKIITYQRKKIDLINMSHANEMYLNKKIAEDYDIPVILADTKKDIEKMKVKKEQTTFIAYILAIAIVGILIILFYLNSKRKVYKQRFEDLINRKEHTSLPNKGIQKEKSSLKSELNIPEEVVSKILSYLEKFEKDKEYLNSKIVISVLAKTIGTNPNYLSKIVNHKKGMSFSQYINTLRIEHAVTSLKNDKIYRKYTLKAIAAEFGFNNTESFSKAFYKGTGIKPSFFLKQIEKSNL